MARYVPAQKKSTFEGLTLGGTAVTGAGTTVTSTTTGGEATINLTDILGERKVSVMASVVSPVLASATESNVPFGKGPLAVFSLGYPGNPDNDVDWSTAIGICSGDVPAIQDILPGYRYYPVTKLPGVDNTDGASAYLTAISGNNYAAMRYAAGMPSGYVWSGRAADVVGVGYARVVVLGDGGGNWDYVGYVHQVLCVRP